MHVVCMCAGCCGGKPDANGGSTGSIRCELLNPKCINLVKVGNIYKHHMGQRLFAPSALLSFGCHPISLESGGVSTSPGLISWLAIPLASDPLAEAKLGVSRPDTSIASCFRLRIIGDKLEIV